MNDYKDKIEREKKWHTEHKFQKDHFLNSRLLFSSERNSFNYIFPKQQMAAFINTVVKASGLNNPAILIVPVGTGNDINYIQHLSNDITGADISEEAIKKIENQKIKKHICDIKKMDIFPENTFDIVITPLFFHHFLGNFDDFLIEIYRVLKPNGHFISLEPSLLHPATWLTRFTKHIAGNITGQVEDEAPFIPLTLLNAMKRCEFKKVKVSGGSFTHSRIPIWMAKINNIITYPLLKIPIVNHFAWLCIFYGNKQKIGVAR
jgi:SAM-dependent methyltransferase